MPGLRSTRLRLAAMRTLASSQLSVSAPPRRPTCARAGRGPGLVFPCFAFLTSPFRPPGTMLAFGGPQLALRSLTIRWRKPCFLTVDHQAGQQGGRSRPHLNCDPPQPPVARLAQAVVLLLLAVRQAHRPEPRRRGEFAFDAGTPALTSGIGLTEDVCVRAILLEDDAGALPVGLQALIVGVGIVALVGRYVAGTWINQAHELLAVGHVPGRHRRRDQFAVRIRDSPGVSGPLLGES